MLSGACGWITYAPGARDSSGVIWTGSGSYSTLTAAAAARACSRVSAATAMIGSPRMRTLSSQRTGWSGWTWRSRFVPLMSEARRKPTTPGIFSAAEVSMDLMMPWNTVLRTTASSTASGGSGMSSLNCARPQALSIAVGRTWETPSMLLPSRARTASGVVSFRMNRPASWTASMIFL